MTALPTYASALGIATGDIVTTSYGTGPYVVVGICGPRIGSDGTEYIDLGLKLADGAYPHAGPRSRSGFGIIGVWREGERWFTGSKPDEVFVEKRPGVVLGQGRLVGVSA